MANEITVTITESWTGTTGTINSTREHQISDIVDMYKRVITVPSGTDATIAIFDDAISDATTCPFDLQSVEYIRVTNLGSNDVNLQQIIDNAANGTADATCSIKLATGESWMFWNPDGGILTDDDASTYAAPTGDLLGLLVDSASAATTVELVVASKTAS